MTLTLDQVRHVAKLSELELTESELQAMTRDLSAILAHVDQLQGLVTQRLDPAESSGPTLPLRPDQPHPGIRHEDALRQAPKPLDGGFAVPGFVED